MDLKAFRSQYPQYDSIPDQKLVDGLHNKFYSQLPKDEFYNRIGFATPAPEAPAVTQEAPTTQATSQPELTAPVGAREEPVAEQVPPAPGVLERVGNFFTQPLPVSDADKLIAGSLKKGFKQLGQVPAATEYAELSGLQNAREAQYGKDLENAPPEVKARHEETANRLAQLQKDAAVAGVERKQIEAEYGVNPLAKKLEKLSSNPEYQEGSFWDKTKQYGSALLDNAKDIPGYIGTLGLESLPASTATIATALLTRGLTKSNTLAAASAGGTSGFMEFGNSYADMREKGMSHEEAWEKAAVKSGVIGFFDAVSFGSAGKAANEIMKKVEQGAALAATKQTVKGSTIQGAYGAAGEGGGSAVIGEDLDPAKMGAEFAGEFFLSPLEGAAAYAGYKQAAQTPPAKPTAEPKTPEQKQAAKTNLDALSAEYQSMVAEAQKYPAGSAENQEATQRAFDFFDTNIAPIIETPIATETLGVTPPQEEMVTSTAPGISVSYPKERTEPSFTVDPETGEVLPVGELNVKSLSGEQPGAEAVAGRTEPSVSLPSEGAATTEGVAPLDTDGLDGAVGAAGEPVVGAGAQRTALDESLPSTYAELPVEDKVPVLEEAQQMWQAGEATLPIAKAWNSLPSWKRDMFAAQVYENYDEITTSGEAFRAAMDKVIEAKKPADAEAAVTKVKAPVAPVEQQIQRTEEEQLELERVDAENNIGKPQLRKRLESGQLPIIDSSSQGDGSITYFAKGVGSTNPDFLVTLDPTPEEKRAAKIAEADIELADSQEERETARKDLAKALQPAAERALAVKTTAATATTPEAKKEATAQRNVARQEAKKAEATAPVEEVFDQNYFNKELARLKNKVSAAERVERRANMGPDKTAAEQKLAKANQEIDAFFAKQAPLLKAAVEKTIAESEEREAKRVKAAAPATTPALQDIPQNILDLHKKYERMTAMANGRIPAEPNAKGVSPRPQDLKREETMSFRRLFSAVENLTGDRSGEPNAPTMQMLARLSESSRAENKRAEAAAPVEEKETVPTMQEMQDAGFTSSEIENLKKDYWPERYRQIKEGYKYIAGEFRQVTQADVDTVKKGNKQRQVLKAEAKEKMDKAFAEDPNAGVSNIVGSDWGMGAGANQTTEQYQKAAYAALDRKYGFADSGVAILESRLAAAKKATAPTTTPTAPKKRGRPAKPKVEGAEAKTPKPRGRRKIELTPEEQARKDAERGINQAEAIKAGRDVDKLINFLSSEFDPANTKSPDFTKVATQGLDSVRREYIYKLHEFATNNAYRTKPASGGKARDFLANSDKITRKERADLQTRLKFEETRPPKPSAARAKSSGKVNPALYEFETATQAIDHIMLKGTPFERLLAARLKPFVTDVNLSIATTKEDTPEKIALLIENPKKDISASGVYSSARFGDKVHRMIEFLACDSR
jgi:hypothetical protein